MSTLRAVVFSTDNPQSLKQIVVGSDFTGEQFMQIACIQLGIPFNMNSQLHATMQDGTTIIVNLEQTLESQGILNGSSFCIGDNYGQLPLPPLHTSEFPQIQQDEFEEQYQQFMIPPSSLKEDQVREIQINPIDLTVLDFPENEIEPPSSQFPAPPSYFPAEEQSVFVPPIDLTVPEFPSDSENSIDSSEGSEESDIVIKNNKFETAEFDTSCGISFSLGTKENATQMYTFYEFQDNHEKPIYYDNKFKLKQVIQVARQVLQLRNNDYVALLCFSDNEKRWFEEDLCVEEHSCYDGMAIRIFRKELVISINSIHFETFKFKFNITDTVGELVKQIAQEKGINNYAGYTLMTRETTIKGSKMKTREIPLDLEKDLPHQITDMKELKFGRCYFVFSHKDLQSMDSAMLAYKDAAIEMKNGSTKLLSKEDAVRLAALSIIIENDKNNFDINSIPDEVGQYLPSHYPDHKTLGSEVRKFLEQNGVPDKINAVRLYLKHVRLVPDFNMQKFKYTNDTSLNSEMQALINPLCVTIVNQEGDISCRIPYNDIIELECEDQVLSILYQVSNDNNFSAVTIRTKKCLLIYRTIITYQRIIRNLLMERAQLRLEGKWSGPVSPNDIIHVNAYNDFTDKNPSLFEIDRNFTGQMLLQILTKNMNISLEDPSNKDLAILVKLRNIYKWAEPMNTLSQIGMYDNIDVYIVHVERNMKIYLPNGTDIELKINAQSKSEKVISDIFTALKQPYVYGYSLYYINENNELVPSSSESTVPEQSLRTDSLYLKRRFFTLTRDDLKNDLLTTSAFFDSREYILTKEVSITDQVAVELAILDYITEHEDLQSYQNFKDTDFQWEKMFPKSISIKKSLKKAFLEAFANHEIIDKKHAMKKYLTIVRELPYFGGESYQITMRDSDYHRKKLPKTFQDAIIKICPLNIFLLETNGKVIHKLFWRQVISYEASKKSMRLTFRNAKGDEIINVDIRSKSMQDILMMIKGSWTIFVTIMQLHRKEDEAKQEERNKRHNGGFTDNGKVHGPQVDLYVITDLVTRKKTKLVWLDIDMTQQEVLNFMRKLYNTNPKDKYGLMIENSESYTWLLSDMKIKDVDVKVLSNLFYLNIRPKLKIQDDNGQTKEVVLRLEVPLVESIKEVCDEFGIKQSIGYTLFAPEKTKNNELFPLELNSTLPEQISSFEGLVLRRRFFVITKLDFESQEAFNQIYNDIRRMVNSGVMDISLEMANELAFYQMSVDMNPLTEKAIPENCSNYLPKNIKQNRNMKLEIKKYMKLYPKLTVEEAQRQFIEHARSIQSFACERYSGYYFSNVKGNRRMHEISVVITPYRFYVTEKQTNTLLINIQHEFIYKIEELEGRLCISYTGLDKQNFVLDMESTASRQIKNVIDTYYSIKCQLLKLRITDDFKPEEISSGEHLLIFAHIGVDNDKHRSIAFDQRCNGQQLVQRLRKLLNLNEKSSL
ncbi:hypothetical protein TVAG_336330 [Trichomonas vaginalis G3]|uniref:FERM domain-containing protein n=1 Tax=Trichomonas vaginalis (strain ATCC PRA-98 / G3) TaxID=412133 RepID=A2FIM8_TRIV3|nr:tyrosine-protein phosphatase family [Trichomonas vaginalis G3]EAX95238.1 hypothetical protein TVAG_336330 [Trichomonas vaginalis G3]KAI5503486.1 tyrosine-protein phosphatase family [Trichomonas vaginalis G3]|eukprot:XP_001308168.1 hypothetical protein [Trichomonas vaginalis G3]